MEKELLEEKSTTISVSVKGAYKTIFLDELRTTLNDIFKSYKNKKPDLQYRIQRFGEVIIKGNSENELWLLEDKIINHFALDKPYLDDVVNSLISMKPIIELYKILTNINPSMIRANSERVEFSKRKKVRIKKLKKAELEKVLNELEKYIEEKKDTYSERELTLLTARFYRAENNFGKGIMELKNYTLEMKQINEAILKFIDKLE